MALDLLEIGKQRGPPPIIEIVAYAAVATSPVSFCPCRNLCGPDPLPVASRVRQGCPGSVPRGSSRRGSPRLHDGGPERPRDPRLDVRSWEVRDAHDRLAACVDPGDRRSAYAADRDRIRSDCDSASTSPSEVMTVTRTPLAAILSTHARRAGLTGAAPVASNSGAGGKARATCAIDESCSNPARS